MKEIYLFIAIFVISFILINIYYEKQQEQDELKLSILNYSYTKLQINYDILLETHNTLLDDHINLIKKGAD